MRTKMRTVQTLLDNGFWLQLVEPLDVKKGDVFRMFEPDGSPVFVGWRIACKDSYLNGSGIPTFAYIEEEIITNIKERVVD